MDTVDTVSLALATDAIAVLQRVPRGALADEFAARIAKATGRPIRLVESPTPPVLGEIRVLDGRKIPPGGFEDWDEHREELATPEAPLVVMLDVVSARQLLREAPHVASWAGGIRLPVEALVRPAASVQERRMGRNALSRVLHEHPELVSERDGEIVGVEIGSDRLFLQLPDTSPLQRARLELDEGMIYLVRLGDPDLDEEDDEHA